MATTTQMKIIGNKYESLATNPGNKISRFKWSSFRDPSSNARLIWSLIIMSLIIYTPMEIAWNGAFSIDLSECYSCFVAAVIIDVFLFIDIIINFITPYYDKHCIQHKAYAEIARNYCFGSYSNQCSIRYGGWFWIDLVTTIPFEAFYTLSFVFAIFKTILLFLRFIKLLRLVKLVDQIKLIIQQKFGLTYVLLFRIFRIVLSMLVMAHLVACLWIYVGFLNMNKTNGSWLSDICDDECYNIDNWRLYSYALHWSLVNLFTTGHGISVSATNEHEEILTTFCVLLSTFFFAFLIGTATNIINEGDPRKSIKNQKLEQAQAFCEHHGLSNHLSTKILKRIQYYCDQNLFDDNEIFNILPQYLQSQISKEVAPLLVNDQISFEKIEFFGFLPVNEQNKIIGSIVLSMKAIQCDANCYLYRKNDIAKEFYIFRSGDALLKGNRNNERTLERGDVCGEYGIINTKRKSYVISKTLSEFYMIKIEDMQQIFEQNYANQWEAKWKEMQHCMKQNYGKSRICPLQSQDSSNAEEIYTSFCCGPDHIPTPRALSWHDSISQQASFGSDVYFCDDATLQNDTLMLLEPVLMNSKQEKKSYAFSTHPSVQLTIIPSVKTDEYKYNDYQLSVPEITDKHAILDENNIEKPDLLSPSTTDYDPILNESYY